MRPPSLESVLCVNILHTDCLFPNKFHFFVIKHMYPPPHLKQFPGSATGPRTDKVRNHSIFELTSCYTGSYSGRPQVRTDCHQGQQQGCRRCPPPASCSSCWQMILQHSNEQCEKQEIYTTFWMKNINGCRNHLKYIANDEAVNSGYRYQDDVKW